MTGLERRAEMISRFREVLSLCQGKVWQKLTESVVR